MKKKTIALTMTAILTAMSLAGCGGQKTEAPAATDAATSAAETTAAGNQEGADRTGEKAATDAARKRSEEHTSELQSLYS